MAFAPIRKALFWVHLVSGLVAGVVIAVMAATGIVIAFEEEILAWCDREVSQTVEPVAGAGALTLEKALERVESDDPGGRTAAITIHRDGTKAWEFYTEDDRHLYVDRFSGTAEESKSGRVHEWIHKIEEWHRWLGAKDGLVSSGRVVTGVGNLALVLLCLTGLWLWFPRRWNWRALRPVLWFKPGFRGKARDFNWHNVFGFWSLLVVLVLALTGVVISFGWGHRLVFTMAGEEAPESRNYGMMAVPPPIVEKREAGTSMISIDGAFERVKEAFPGWESISMDLPPAVNPDQPAPLEFGVELPDYMPSRAYIPVQTDPYSGEILQSVRFGDRSAGLQARVWIRFLHTGGAFGLPGKIVASLASAVVLILVWTGFALSWRRFSKRRSRPPEPGARTALPSHP